MGNANMNTTEASAGRVDVAHLARCLHPGGSRKMTYVGEHFNETPGWSELAAEVIRLAQINVQLCADFNTMNQHGAKQDAEIANLKTQIGMANYAEDTTRAEIARLTQINAELTAANAALMVRVEAARGLLHGWQEIDDVGTNGNYPAIANGTRAWLAGGGGMTQTMKISVCPFVGGDFDVMIRDEKTGEEVTLSGKQALTDAQVKLLTRLVPSCVWTEYRTDQA